MVIGLIALVAGVAVAAAEPAGAVTARHNIKPHPNFIVACVDDGPMSHTCISQTVKAINYARAREGVRRMVLPTNYRRLSIPEQVFVIVDLERVDRGVRPLRGMESTMNQEAKTAAEAQVDPHPATFYLQSVGVHKYRTVYGRDYGALAADYEWMYDDGYSPGAGGTTNIVCPSPGASGCWSHRVAILDRFKGLPLLMAGTGDGNGVGGTNSVTAILTGGYGNAPHFTYRWSEARIHGADDHKR